MFFKGTYCYLQYKSHLYYYIFFISVTQFKLLEDFIEEFFYQNPISQLGVIITRNKRAEKVSELAGNSKKHIKVNLLLRCFSRLHA